MGKIKSSTNGTIGGAHRFEPVEPVQEPLLAYDELHPTVKAEVHDVANIMECAIDYANKLDELHEQLEGIIDRLARQVTDEFAVITITEMRGALVEIERESDAFASMLESVDFTIADERRRIWRAVRLHKVNDHPTALTPVLEDFRSICFNGVPENDVELQN